MELVTVHDVQAWLKSYGELRTAIENQRERLDTMRSRLVTPRAATPTGMPRGGGARVDRIGVELGQIEVLEDELAENQTAARELYRQIDNTVSRLHGPGWPDKRFVLRARYLDLCGWEEIAKMRFHRKPDFEGKQDTYLRRTFYIHKSALVDLLELYNELIRGSENHETE